MSYQRLFSLTVGKRDQLIAWSFQGRRPIVPGRLAEAAFIEAAKMRGVVEAPIPGDLSDLA
jgi:hypothetical protein